MESEGDIIIDSQPEPEDDEYGCYFLEPTPHPYNITEKILKANGDLFASIPSHRKEKSSRVRFKEELISFEPELTDEDVNSIDSDPIVQSPPSETVEAAEEAAAEEIVEELDSEEDNTVVALKSELGCDAAVKDERVRISRRSKQKKSFWNADVVQCKKHCINKLDFAPSMSINKLEIHEKTPLPPLQLLQRKCCEGLHQQEQKTLPNYNGFRSEYGLTLRQLEKREQQMDTLRMRERTRRRIVEESRQRKMRENEEVFSQWLKEVSERKRLRKQPYSPHVVSLPNKSTGSATKERPRTANCFVPKAPVKKLRRPSSCVYIEVPQEILERSFNIGDLIITNSKSLTKRLHILALS